MLTGIKRYSKSYAPKVVTALLSEYSNIDRKLFYKRAKELGMDKVEQAVYLQLLRLQNQQSIGRREIIGNILRKNYTGMDPEKIEQIVREAEVYALEWFPTTPIRGTEYFPIKKFEVEKFTKEELLENLYRSTTLEGWQDRLNKYRVSYLKAISVEYGLNSEAYRTIEQLIMAMSWQQFLLFTTTRSGRISYRYENIEARRLMESMGYEYNEGGDRIWKDIQEALNYM